MMKITHSNCSLYLDILGIHWLMSGLCVGLYIANCPGNFVFYMVAASMTCRASDRYQMSCDLICNEVSHV